VGLALAEIAAGLPMAASLAFAGGISTFREGRRRCALNEAVHELRRPLQVLALAAPEAEDDAVATSLAMATIAVERLEWEINGKACDVRDEVVQIRPLIEAAVSRWSRRAALVGASVRLRWWGGSPTLTGGGFELAQALDNLIINGIEHGGGDVLVEVAAGEERVRLVVRDGGRTPAARRRPSPRHLWQKVTGRQRHGHGLRVVRRTAAALGGSFRLIPGSTGSEAVLELPTRGERER
jgi:signal transduction histidine kinase